MEFVNLAIGQRGFPRVRTKLDGVVYLIEAIWVDGAFSPGGVWSISLYRADGTLLQPSLIARHGEDLLAPFPGAEYPGAGRGKLRVWDTSRNQRDPGRRDLAHGSAVRLVYIPAAEVA